MSIARQPSLSRSGACCAVQASALKAASVVGCPLLWRMTTPRYAGATTASIAAIRSRVSPPGSVTAAAAASIAATTRAAGARTASRWGRAASPMVTSARRAELFAVHGA